MGSIIALANQKGGVGKTTLAVHAGVGLARRGARVILVDADPQGNLTSWLLDGETDAGMFNLLIVGGKPVSIVRGLRQWNVGLVTGNDRTGEAMRMLAAVNRLDEIPGRLRPLADVADHVIIDMPPSRSPGFTELLSAADWIIVPTQLERLSLEGVGLMAQAARQIQREQAINRPRLMGIVPNMTRSRTNEHRDQMDELAAVFGSNVWPPVPMTIRVTEATSFGTVVYDHCPDHKVTRQMHLIVDRIQESTND
jgi:chromosome partitioning protein